MSVNQTTSSQPFGTMGFPTDVDALLYGRGVARRVRSAAAVAWLSTLENIASLTADDDDWLERSTPAELRVAELQGRPWRY